MPLERVASCSQLITQNNLRSWAFVAQSNNTRFRLDCGLYHYSIYVKEGIKLKLISWIRLVITRDIIERFELHIQNTCNRKYWQ
jgi:hypothetical protein